MVATAFSDVKAGGFTRVKFSLLVLDQTLNAQTWQFMRLALEFTDVKPEERQPR